MMLWALFQQNRFAYYYAVNVAVLSAYFGITVADKILGFGDWNELLGKKSNTRANIHKKKDMKKASKNWIAGYECFFILKKIKVSHLISLLIVIFSSDILYIHLSDQQRIWENTKRHENLLV